MEYIAAWSEKLGWHLVDGNGQPLNPNPPEPFGGMVYWECAYCGSQNPMWIQYIRCPQCGAPSGLVK